MEKRVRTCDALLPWSDAAVAVVSLLSDAGRMQGFQSNDASVSVAINPTMPRRGSQEQVVPV